METSEKKETSDLEGVKYLQWTSTVSNTTMKLLGQRPYFCAKGIGFVQVYKYSLTDCGDFEKRLKVTEERFYDE